jgi:hypothetical protein
LLYPNPTTGQINLDLKNIIAAEINIKNALGQLVFVQSEVTSGLIDISDVNPGMYFITLISIDGSTISKKIVKQ